MNLKEYAEQTAHNARNGYRMGKEDGFSGVTRAAGLADGAFTLLFVLIIVTVAALVGGEFIDAVGYETDTDGNPETDWDAAIMDIENHAGTGFILFAVGLLVIPAAAIVGYLWTTMGGVAGGFTRQGR